MKLLPFHAKIRFFVVFSQKVFLTFISYQFKMRRKSWSKHSTIIFLISFLGAYELSELSGFQLLLFLKWLASFPMRNILLFLACEKALLFLFFSIHMMFR